MKEKLHYTCISNHLHSVLIYLFHCIILFVDIILTFIINDDNLHIVRVFYICARLNITMQWNTFFFIFIFLCYLNSFCSCHCTMASRLSCTGYMHSTCRLHFRSWFFSWEITWHDIIKGWVRSKFDTSVTARWVGSSYVLHQPDIPSQKVHI